jgi:sugar lactone lactonase YvrE
MLRVLALVLGVAAAFATLVAASPGATPPFPQVIPLDGGFQPEGIEVGKGTTFYVGSRVTGAIAVGDLHTGEQTTLVQGGVGRRATGIELDQHNRLFVAGAGTGDAYVYDAKTGALLETYDFASLPPDTFINDVVVTPKAAYFTDTRRAVIYKVPIGPGGALADPEDFETIPLTADLVGLNGIDATPDGKTLIAVKSNTGSLFAIDPETGDADAIDLGLKSVPNGDGILLSGKTLYVVQNTLNQVAVIKLAPDLLSGEVADLLTDPDFRVPTTIDELGHRLYAVNARFGVTNPGDPATEYEVVQLAKPAGL